MINKKKDFRAPKEPNQKYDSVLSDLDGFIYMVDGEYFGYAGRKTGLLNKFKTYADKAPSY
jgi:hypothetical protein